MLAATTPHQIHRKARWRKGSSGDAALNDLSDLVALFMWSLAFGQREAGQCQDWVKPGSVGNRPAVTGNAAPWGRAGHSALAMGAEPVREFG